MANGGWHGTQEEWARLETPLIAIDSVIEEFATSAGLAVEKNGKDWPGRSMRWGTEVRCVMQIYLVDELALTWNIWLCCSRDAHGERLWQREFLVKQEPVETFQGRLANLLRVGRQRLIDWSNHPETLEFATKLGSWAPK